MLRGSDAFCGCTCSSDRSGNCARVAGCLDVLGGLVNSRAVHLANVEWRLLVDDLAVVASCEIIVVCSSRVSDDCPREFSSVRSARLAVTIRVLTVSQHDASCIPRLYIGMQAVGEGRSTLPIVHVSAERRRKATYRLELEPYDSCHLVPGVAYPS